MSRSDLHKRMQHHSAKFLSTRSDIVSMEISAEKFGVSSVYDVLGVDLEKQNIWTVEVKTSKEDFTRDEKLLVDSGTYLEQSNFSFVCIPNNTIDLDEIPAPIGVLYYYRNTVPIKYIEKDLEQRDVLERRYTNIKKDRMISIINSKEWSKESENRYIKVIEDNNIELSIIIQNMFSTSGKRSIDEVSTPVIKLVREATYLDQSFCKNLSDLITLTRQVGKKTTKRMVNKSLDMSEVKCYNINQSLGI
jgi:hypothetical protein